MMQEAKDLVRQSELGSMTAEIVLRAAGTAALAVPPLWPLASNVAVNPFLGQTMQSLAEVAARLRRVAGVPVTMPRAWYRDRIASGEIIDADLKGAIASAPGFAHSVVALKEAAHQSPARPPALPTVADLAAKVSGIDWPGVIAERLGAWAAGYFDDGQALWAAPKGKGAYSAWRAVATHDLTPEIIGLSRFATFVSNAPEGCSELLVRATTHLGIPGAALETYFHQLLSTLGAWAQFARYHLWQADLAGETDGTLVDFLAIRLLWEEALFEQYREQLEDRWREVVGAHARPVEPDHDQLIDVLLQEAAERAAQRGLADMLARTESAAQRAAPVLQAAFCIDVRSEVFRRALESINPNIQTLGFAGFFGIGTSHRRFASDISEHRLPVLLKPGLTTRAGGAADSGADQAARYKARATRAWGRFKLAAVSSFAFVEATGPLYALKLVGDALGLTANKSSQDPLPRADPTLDLPTSIKTAGSILRAMSLTRDFAPLILLVGHAANVTNNPHASALHCGACGGYAGDVNARLLAGLLNNADVRAGLIDTGITIPAETLFVGALHDTTTDAVTLYVDDNLSPSHRRAIEEAQRWLAAAGVLARSERALRLPRAHKASQLIGRSRDWSETRPEWGLAGCKAFIAAPRARTVGKNLQGRAFMHDYVWRDDEGFSVLELIMTAPVVVASWISLQYYGSTVCPTLFGSGNKLLHNVVGGIGVVEGNGGVLRAGLPWQSVHDGRRLVHEPLRLSVCIEAPMAAMNEILSRHADVRALFDNHWLHLFALDDEGQIAFRYAGNLTWHPFKALPHID